MRAELRAEWTKFRTVRGWVVGMIAGAAVIVGLGLVPGMGGSCGNQGPGSECTQPTGPGGELVTDHFMFVHQTLAGDGRITVRATALTGQIFGEGGYRPGLVPWAKAGLIIKDGTAAGSAYAAIMVTGDHGVRLQHNYTNDTPGQPGQVSQDAPRWLRLTRTGDTITGEESFDGTQWTVVGTVHLAGLPSTVQAGLFTASPQYTAIAKAPFGLQGIEGGPSRATATFDHVERQGAWSGDTWTGERLGGPDDGPANLDGKFTEANGVLTVAGSGDIAPAVSGGAGLGTTITQTLAGTFVGLILAVVVGAMFITAEYRRGLIRVSLAAQPRRLRMLAAKAIVLGSVTLVAGVAAAAVVVPFGQQVLRNNGAYVAPADFSTELRLVLGTGALLAVASIMALALGTLLRRSAIAVTTAVLVIVMPYILAMSILPAGAGRWLLRISPAAAFSVQQAAMAYKQVDSTYLPTEGYFPLAPWAGFAVLCGWTLAALVAAAVVLRRRDV
jgi:ABC-type transport system involved in multi-copper enzyme maturation permease subunit